MKRRRVVVGAVVLAAVGAVAWMASSRAVLVDVVRPVLTTVRQFVVEDGKTRLDEDYWISMPIAGRVERITLDEGKTVKRGQVLARIEDYELAEQARSLEAQIAEIEHKIEGVLRNRPKDEDVKSAELKVERATLQLDLAKKERAIAEVDAAEAKKQFERSKKLREARTISQVEFDEAERRHKMLVEQVSRYAVAVDVAAKQLELAKVANDRLVRYREDNEYQRQAYASSIERIRAELNIVKDQLGKTRITSPVDGLVLEKLVESRQFLPAGARLLRVGDFATIEIEADVLSEEVTQVQEKQRVEITGKALNERTLWGTVKRIYPTGFEKISSLGIEQQRVKVIIAFDNSKLHLRPGVSVDLRIIVAERARVPAVPATAVFKQQGRWHVFAVRGGRLALVPIEVGLRNDDHVEIVSGLSQSAQVVTDPSSDLEDGLAVKPVEQTTSAIAPTTQSR